MIKKFQWELIEKMLFQEFCIIWKLNEGWPLKKDSVTVFKFLILKIDSITFLRLLDFLTSKKDSISSWDS